MNIRPIVCFHGTFQSLHSWYLNSREPNTSKKTCKNRVTELICSGGMNRRCCLILCHFADYWETTKWTGIFSWKVVFKNLAFAYIQQIHTQNNSRSCPQKIHIAVSKSFKKNSFCTCLHPCRVFNASKFKSVTQAMLSIIWLVWPATDLQPSHIYHKWWHNIITINNDKISS